MKTYSSNIQASLIDAGFSINKINDVWALLENSEIILVNRRLGDLIKEAADAFGI